MLYSGRTAARFRRRTLTLVGACSFALAASQALARAQPAGAQDASSNAAAPATAAPNAEPNAAAGLDIVVTAQKRSERLRDVPISVTAVSGTQLAQSNIARLTDLVALVPNFTLSLAALQPVTFVRGFGTTGSFSFEQAVGKFVDNVSYGRDFDGRYPLYDLERLEVLKGPQVLLYGNSATAEAIILAGGYFERNNSHIFVPTDLNLSAIGAPVPPFARVTTYDFSEGGTALDLLTSPVTCQTSEVSVRFFELCSEET